MHRVGDAQHLRVIVAYDSERRQCRRDPTPVSLNDRGKPDPTSRARCDGVDECRRRVQFGGYVEVDEVC